MTNDESLLREMWCAYTLHATPRPFDVREAMAAVLAVVREHDGTRAARDVLAERRRQVEAEGWTPEHDDEHSHGELATAAACYARCNGRAWPWFDGWKPSPDCRRNLVKAGALLLAEIERLDRAEGKA